MKTLFSVATAVIFSLASVSAATIDLGNGITPAPATVLAAVATPLRG